MAAGGPRRRERAGGPGEVIRCPKTRGVGGFRRAPELGPWLVGPPGEPVLIPGRRGLVLTLSPPSEKRGLQGQARRERGGGTIRLSRLGAVRRLRGRCWRPKRAGTDAPDHPGTAAQGNPARPGGRRVRNSERIGGCGATGTPPSGGAEEGTAIRA